MCVFYQESYIRLLKLLMTSILEKGNINKHTTDILIITSAAFQPIIQETLGGIDLPIRYHIFNLHTMMEASCCKLNIFQYNEIDKYQKILYLDVDVLVNSNINVLFDTEIHPEKLHALEEGTIGDWHWGKEFFDFTNTQFNAAITGFSAGVFYFMNNESIKTLFQATNEHIAKYLSAGGKIPTCLDQPFLVFNSVVQDKCDNQFMKKYLENNPSAVSNEKIIYHFPGGPGSYGDKLHKMNAFWKIIQSNIVDTILNNRFTMVSKERLINLYNHCKKFKNTNYSFIECGVAKGGCLALMSYTAGNNNKIYGFDSFEGMPDITEKDIGDYNKSNIYGGFGSVGDNLSGGIENVYNTFKILNIDMKNTTLIKGFFKDTLNIQENIDSIENIGVLRLDGDWYESTRICLEKLYDKVVVGGIIIIDDYGHWIGAKRATDEFRAKHNILAPLIQTDYTEYYWIKTPDTPSTFDTRNEMLQYYCNKLTNPKLLEIGVFKGDFLDYLVKHCKTGSIDAVDLFEGVTCSGDSDGNNVVHYDVGKSYTELLTKYTGMTHIQLYKSDSVTFLQSREDNTYDIIYIDGDHSYSGVKNDLINAFSKIKNGGYIMGHDYEMNMKKTRNNYNFGVKEAVDEFCITYKQTILSKAFDGCVSYCICINK
jgi:lipopolysaccharide biosynthesis glycosyltransferase